MSIEAWVLIILFWLGYLTYWVWVIDRKQDCMGEVVEVLAEDYEERTF